MGSVLISTVVSHRRKTTNNNNRESLNNNKIVCSKVDNKSEILKRDYFHHQAELFFKKSVKIGKINKFVHREVNKKQVVSVNRKVNKKYNDNFYS